MWTPVFWVDVLERVITSAAETAVGAIGATYLIQGVDWKLVAGASSLAAVATLLKALAARKVGDPSSAALLPSDRG